MRKHEPVMVVFAGNNGSGKSTYRSLNLEHMLDFIHVDPDYIARQFTGEARNPAFAGGREAIVLVDTCITKRKHFSIESTVSGHLIFRQIMKAKEHGYRIQMYLFGTELVDINIERICARVKGGGHHIPEDLVRNREAKTIRNVVEHLDLLDYLSVIDTTGRKSERVLSVREGTILYQSPNIPSWVTPICQKLLH